MSLTRTITVGVLLFLGFALAFAPAALIRTLLPAGSGVELFEPGGTLWDGSAALYISGQPAGRVSWDVRAVTLLQGRLGYNVSLSGDEHALEGVIAVGVGSGTATLRGRAAAAYVNRWLAPYDIAITGDLSLHNVSVEVPYDVASSGAGSASGSVTWQGGPVRYRLAGRPYRGDLPPLVAYLGESLETVIYPQDGQTPLIKARILPNGFVRIGVTQLLTRLVGNPWPGSHTDHEVVLEVEEQLF